MLTLYDYLPSQNAYKVRLLLSHLGKAYRTKPVSIFEGEGQCAEFLAVSPAGAVPVIELEDGRTLAESNAILGFLAEGTRFLPAEAFSRAKIAQWLFFEGDYVQASVATLRHWVMTGKDKRRPPELVAAKRTGSMKSLSILERELARHEFLGGGAYTIADMSVFAYVHLADQADLPLGDFPSILRWIAAVRAQPGFLDKVHPYSIDPHSGRELP